MYTSVDQFMETVINKNPAEQEFHQAVKEVVESIWEYLEENSHYERSSIKMLLKL